MPHARSGFPYVERANAAESARLGLHAAFRDVRKRNDKADPATERWLQAIAGFHAALRCALPKHFAEELKDLTAGNRRAVPHMIDFLEADPYFFRSGYLKADVIRAIRQVPLSTEQSVRLAKVVLAVLDKGDRREFRHYCRLARTVRSPTLEAEIQSRFETGQRDLVRRAGWMLYAIRQKP